MTVRELYETLGGDYKEAMSRLMNDQFASLMLKKFLANNEYGKMAEAFAQGDRASAFRYSHNLKGVCLNLELGRLAGTASAICDSVRGGAPTADLAAMAKQAEEEYALVMEGIRSLQASQ